MAEESLSLYYNHRCSKCRIAKDFLEKNGFLFRIIEYLDSEITTAEIKELLRKGDLKAKDVIRRNEEEYRLYVKGEDLSEEELINLICEHPKLLQRPIISSSQKSIVARDEDSLNQVKSW